MGEWMYRSTFYRPRHYLEVSGHLQVPAVSSPGERAPGTHWIGGWVDPRAGLDDLERENSWTYRDSSSDSSVVQSVVSLYTDWAIPASQSCEVLQQICEMYFLILLCFVEQDETVLVSFRVFLRRGIRSISEQPVSKIENWIIYFEHGSHMFVLRCFRLRVGVIYLLLCRLFYAVVRAILFTASYDVMMDEWWTEKYLQGSDRGFIEVLYQHSPGETLKEEKKKEKQDNWCPGRDSNWAPPSYESAMPTHPFFF
jgi:hypothetical protein